MALSKLRQAIDLVKDQTSIGLAKLNNNSATLSDLEVAIVRATRHEEYPPEEKHIREILCLTSYSRGHVGSCVTTIARRLSKTKNWVVALKTLMLIHRLLNDGHSLYEQEIFFATRRGTRLLNMSDFRDTSRSDSWDYSAFVRTYALYLDEILDNRMQGKRGKRSAYSYRDESDEENKSEAIVLKSTPIREMKFDQLFLKANHSVQIIERFLACRPTGHARTNILVLMALYPIVKESFRQYYDITELLGILIDRFMELDVPESIKVHEIFCRCAKQFDEIHSFYCWTKTMGIARRSEYPKVEHISEEKLQVMDEFIRENMDIQKNGKTIEETIIDEIEIGPELDTTPVKALPPPPDLFAVQREEKAIVEVKTEEEKPQELMGDLLNLGDDSRAMNEHGDQLALALFDGLLTTATTTTGPPPWEAFKDTSDWETALVQSASYLSNQHAQLPHGFDTLLLDAMYQEGATTNQYTTSSGGFIGTGSSSSVALGSAGMPTMLALPAVQTQNGLSNAFCFDPFAPSLSIPPPPYVQIHDMEMRQRHLVEEQLIWQQYSRDGMHGQMAFGQMQPNPYYYNTSGYTQTY